MSITEILLLIAFIISIIGWILTIQLRKSELVYLADISVKGNFIVFINETEKIYINSNEIQQIREVINSTKEVK